MKNNQEKKLMLIEELEPTIENGIKFSIYKCFCGNEFKIKTSFVKNKTTKSCGCLKNKDKITHGSRSHRLYNIWLNIIHRCNNQNNANYKSYGARGITVCDRWLDINNFIEDMYPTFEDGLTLDRIDNNGNYEPTNCRWATKQVQNRNKRAIQSNNTSGYRGSSWHKSCNKWRARIKVNKKDIHLGFFNTALEAACAYDRYIVNNNLEHTKNFA